MPLSTRSELIHVVDDKLVAEARQQGCVGIAKATMGSITMAAWQHLVPVNEGVEAEGRNEDQGSTKRRRFR